MLKLVIINIVINNIFYKNIKSKDIINNIKMDNVLDIDFLIRDFMASLDLKREKIIQITNKNLFVTEELIRTSESLIIDKCKEPSIGKYPNLFYEDNYLIVCKSSDHEHKNSFTKDTFVLIKEYINFSDNLIIFLDRLSIDSISLSKYLYFEQNGKFFNFETAYIESNHIEAAGKVNKLFLEGPISNLEDYDLNHLKGLHLENNELEYFKYNYKNLINLKISNTPRIKKIILDKYNNVLKTIDLNNTSIKYKDLKVFKGLERIKGYCNQKKFNIKEFVKLPNLIELCMERQEIIGDEIINLECISNVLEIFKAKTDMEIYDGRGSLKSLVLYSFNCPSILCKNIRYLEIHAVYIFLTEFLKCTSLETLKLFFKEDICFDINGHVKRYTNIFDISIIENYKTLISLELNNPNFKQGYTFKELINLKEFKIKTKDSYTFNIFTFYGMTSLKILHLSNGIMVKDTLKGLVNLTEVVLDNIQIIPNDLFYELVNLQILKITNSGIKSFDKDLFIKQTNLHKLKISGLRKLKTLPLFTNLFSLVSLDLSNNNLDPLDNNIFSNLTSITEINLLDYKHLKDVSLFQNLDTLRSLNISIEAKLFNDFVFKGLRKLTKLSIDLYDSNDILFITNDLFHQLENLVNLSIDGDATITGNIIKDIGKLKNLKHLSLLKTLVKDANEFNDIDTLLTFYITEIKLEKDNIEQVKINILKNNKNLISYQYFNFDDFISFDEHPYCNK